MRYGRKIFAGLALVVTLSLAVQARELKSSASPLQVLGRRVEHPEDGVTISHVFLRRTFKNKPSVKLEIVHPGYCEPTLLSSRDHSVNALNFDTGAHMRSAVVVLCSGSETRILSDFDARVIAACGAEGKSLSNGYICVSEIQGRTVGVQFMRRGLKGDFARFYISPGGNVKRIPK